jgi:4,5-DOPA dioxygenase extradiol
LSTALSLNNKKVEAVMKNTTQTMPALFVGHGSPMNAIEDNDFTRNWAKIVDEFPTPKAIIAISAHWYTNGSRITDEEHPKMIYDMYGFPDELYKVEYNAKGSPDLAHLVQKLPKRNIMIDNSWGYDHGTWSVLTKMYPEANVPVIQLSVDNQADAETHFQMGKEISNLRENGVLIFASGNIVHNLERINWGMRGGYRWADEFDLYIKDKITKRQYHDVINYENAGNNSKLAFFTPEHFYPLLYILGASNENDKVSIFNDSCVMGSLSMTSYLFR